MKKGLIIFATACAIITVTCLKIYERPEKRLHW